MLGSQYWDPNFEIPIQDPNFGILIQEEEGYQKRDPNTGIQNRRSGDPNTGTPLQEEWESQYWDPDIGISTAWPWPLLTAWP